MKDKASDWHQHIVRQQKSTLTIQAYCDKQRLTIGMFYYWKRKLNQQAFEEHFTELQIVDTNVAIRSTHVRFPNGVEIWFENDPGIAYLRSLAGC